MNNNKTTINKSLTMKKLAFFLVMLAAIAVGQAQTTGSGIVLLTGSPYEFTPTTVDSTTTFEFQLVNTVGVQQVVYFGGLDAPFNVNPLIPTAVPANDTLDMEITFNPSEIGEFSDTLEVLGNVFGNADLVISGQGIQVILDWTPADLSFETTAIGQQSSATVTVTSSGDGAGTISDVVFSNSIFSLDEANSTLSIDEGTSGDLTFLFSPTGAGVFNETVELYTNDPNNSVITIPLTATGISEVSGEVCDVTWSLADSPFTLVGGVTVAEGCTLTIEPGVIVEMQGFTLDMNGDLVCNGTADNPVTVIGGSIDIGPGTPMSVSYLNYVSSGEQPQVTYDAPYELVYYNNFESTEGEYDFDCYDYVNNNYHTGTTTSYSSYGCTSFARTSNDSWSLQSNSGDYYLSFISDNGGDGYLYLAEPPIAPNSGLYDFSFTYESSRYEQNCFMTIDVLDEGNWIALYQSPMDIESNSSLTRLARASYFFEQGEEMHFRIRHDVGYSSGDFDQMYTYIDEVRIETSRDIKNEVKWNFEEHESDFNDLINDWGVYGGESRISIIDDVLNINADQTTISFSTAGWANAPITVPEDGWYFIEVDNRLIHADYNTNNYWEYKSSNDNNSWYRILDNFPPYQTSYAPDTYDWRKDAVHSVEYLTAGSRIDFNYYGYYHSSYSSIEWEGRDFKIYQFDEASSPFTLNLDGAESPIQINREAEVLHFNGTALSVSSPLDLEQSTLSQSLTVESDIQSSQGGYSLIYYNDFESSQGQFDFDCFDHVNNNYHTGNTESYSSYGCQNFNRTEGGSYSLQSNSGDYYLNFTSQNGGDGHIFLAQPLFAPSSGLYDFSFTYESSRYEQDCFMTIDVLDDNNWITLYQSPTDIEGNSTFTRLARATYFFEEGEEMEFRIRHDVGYNSTYHNTMYTYIDEVRIETSRMIKNEVKWEFSDHESDFMNLIASAGEYGGESRISLVDDVLNINADQTTISFSTTSWVNAPITVPEDGWYFIEVDNRLIHADYNTNNYWEYKSSNDNNSWYRILDNFPPYQTSYAPDTYDWRKDAVHSVEYLTAGSRIDFNYYGYYHSGYSSIEWEGRDFRIYQLSSDPADYSNGGIANSNSSMQIGIDGCSLKDIVSDASVQMTINNSTIEGSAASGIQLSGDYSELSIEHSIIANHGNYGIEVTSENGTLALENVVVAENTNGGISSATSGSINYVTIAGNGGNAWNAASGEQNVANNSIFSNNSGNLNSVPLQQFNYVDNYPQFQEGSYMLEPYSPCVDAAMPWNTDQNMPFGMGGLRADMGAYGGPNNAGWGGSPAPDGAATLQAASDTPQDQGYVVGLTFDASAFDNSIISDNISDYAVWRHYDPTGESIASLDEGNWELLGTMPAQGFSGYAYQAEALGNTNAFGTFNSCYTVVAHTDNEDVYWYSNVMCGEAIDNLAPEDPELNGLVLESGGAQISWTPPTEEDYAYTEIFNDDGFTAEVGNDTLVVDVSALAGNTYTYTAVHYDVNGNASDPVSLTLDISAGLDVINLNAGWNLISIDRSLSDGDVEELLSGLQPGNLQYVTGFQNGVQFYDPDGLSFLNTLSELDNGYGYWVKVTEDDVLEVGGASLPLNYRPQLTAGWNLIGYPNVDDSDPADYFADLIAEDNLLYVTGFDQGSQVFDPNGLAFLNTLQELENGFGYWVKTVVGDDPNGMAPANTKSNPAYMVLNGSSQLNDAGGTVDVINALGEVVATMDILEGGYLMTTAVFGADPSDEAATGLQLGEELSFAYNGKLADQIITWEGGMEHRSLALTFSDVTEALTLSPNPAQATTQLTFELLSDASVNIQVSDATGRLVMDLPLGTLTEGAQQCTLGLSQFDAGVYEVSVVADGAIIGTTRLLKQK